MSDVCKFSSLPIEYRSILNGFINGLVDSGGDRSIILGLVKKIYNLYYNVVNCNKIINILLDNIIKSIVYNVLNHLYGKYTTFKVDLKEVINNCCINFDDKFKVYYDSIRFDNNLSLEIVIIKMYECLGIVDIYDKFEEKIKEYSYNIYDDIRSSLCYEVRLEMKNYSKDEGKIQEYFNNNFIELLNDIINNEYKYKIYKLYKLLEGEIDINTPNIDLELSDCFVNKSDNYVHEFYTDGSLQIALSTHSDIAFKLLPLMKRNMYCIIMILMRNMIPYGVIEIILFKYIRNNSIINNSIINNISDFRKYLDVSEFVIERL